MKLQTLLLLLSLPAISQTSKAQEPADILFTNGKIITVDAGFSIGEAMAVRGGRIIAVGKSALLAKFIGKKTQKIDLGGATVMPGLIDSHVHSPGAAMYQFDHPIPNMESIADVLAHIEDRVAKSEAGEWIVLSQVFITRLKERRFPTRQELDGAAPNNPVYFRTGPDAAVNSKALEISGIDKDFKLPEGSGARIERDPKTGELTGIIRSGGGLVKPSPRTSAPSFDDRAAG